MNTSYLLRAPRRSWGLFRAACVGLACAALAFLLPSPALAGQTRSKSVSCGAPGKKVHRVHVQLASTESKDTPSHACVVSLQKVAAAVALTGMEELDFDAFTPEPKATRAYRMGSNRWNTGLTEMSEEIKKSWPSFSVQENTRCATHDGANDICRPQFRLAARTEKSDAVSTGSKPVLEHFLQCTRNDQPFDEQTRVAVVLVEAHTQKPDVKGQPLLCDLKLDRTTLSFNMEEVETDGERVVASILGGDYAEGPARLIEKDSSGSYKVEMALSRRCQPHDIALPPVSLAGTARVRLFLRNRGPDGDGSARDDAHCDATILPGGHFTMTLPYVRETVRRKIQVEVGAKETYDYARYEGSWFDFAPPATIALRQAAISFKWTRHCLYPPERREGKLELDCPEVKLLDTGVTCSSKPEGTKECAYLCDPRPDEQDRCPPPRDVCPDTTSSRPAVRPDARAEVLFDLPVRARFHRPSRPDDQWTDQIVHGGEVLSGYVPPEERFVDVDVSAWLTAPISKPSGKRKTCAEKAREERDREWDACEEKDRKEKDRKEKTCEEKDREQNALEEVLNRRAAGITRIKVRGPNGETTWSVSSGA